MKAYYPPAPVVVTELGTERLCRGCGEYWPVDDEFWYFAADRNGVRRVMGRCKACWSERSRDAAGHTKFADMAVAS